MQTRFDPIPRNPLPDPTWKKPSPCANRIDLGFLLIELLVGMVIVAIVMLALGSVLFTVAQGWEDQDISQSTQLQANQIYARVQSYLSAAKCVASYSSGPTSGAVIFLSANDDPQGQITCGEVSLIIQDPTTHSLYLYNSTPPYSGQATNTFLTSQLAGITAAQVEGWSMQQELLGGPGAQPDSGTRVDVDGFQPYATQTVATASPVTTQLPIVEFTLTLSKNGQSLTLYNSSTLRPSTQPQ
jgi:type II secretory pathway pseudopilin PulG